MFRLKKESMSIRRAVSDKVSISLLMTKSNRLRNIQLI
ncbi:unnamed protein product [Musa acuminata var. zebrina]